MADGSRGRGGGIGGTVVEREGEDGWGGGSALRHVEGESSTQQKKPNKIHFIFYQNLIKMDFHIKKSLFLIIFFQ